MSLLPHDSRHCKERQQRIVAAEVDGLVRVNRDRISSKVGNTEEQVGALGSHAPCDKGEEGWSGLRS